MHIKKFHLTKFCVFRCPRCGFDSPTFADFRCHWRKRHELFALPPRPDVECVSDPYDAVPACDDCGYQTLIPHALHLHDCDQLPVMRSNVLLIERDVRCDHVASDADDNEAVFCDECEPLFIPDPEVVKFDEGVYRVYFTQTLTRDDKHFQAMKQQKAEERNKKVAMGPGLLVSQKRLRNHSSTDLITGIELKERYFCCVHAKEFPTAASLIQHNYSMHNKMTITEAYRCFICAFDGHKYSITRKHVLDFHKEECIDNTLFIVKVTVTGQAKIPICKTCGYSSMDNEIFKEHGCQLWRKRSQQRHNTNKRHVCATCGASFISATHLKRHDEEEHMDWRCVYRCFVCGLDSEDFDVMRAHISDHHDHDRGAVREEHCAVAVPQEARIPQCKRCNFATLLDDVFKRHKCHVWPDTFFQHHVPKKDKPGPHFARLLRTCQRSLEGGSNWNGDNNSSPLASPAAMEMPPMPLSWRPFQCKLDAGAKSSKKSASKERLSARRESHKRTRSTSQAERTQPRVIDQLTFEEEVRAQFTPPEAADVVPPAMDVLMQQVRSEAEDAKMKFIGSQHLQAFDNHASPYFTTPPPHRAPPSHSPVLHDDTVDLPPPPQPPNLMLPPQPTSQCPHCFAVLGSAQACTEHMFDQHTTKTCVYRCPICGFDSTTHAQLMQHVKKKHRGSKVSSNPSVMCVAAGSEFTYIPLCKRGCGFASIDSQSMLFHKCSNGKF